MNIWLIIQTPIAILTVGVWYIFVGMSQQRESGVRAWIWLLLLAVYYLSSVVSMLGHATWAWAVFLLGHLGVLGYILALNARQIVEVVLGITVLRLITAGLAYVTMQLFWTGDGTQQMMEAAVESLYFLMAWAIVLVVWQKRLEHQSSGRREQYRQAIEEKHNEVQLWMHDMKNHLSCLHGLLELKDYEGALNYVQSMDERLQSVAIHKYTEHPIVNILLSDKLRRAQESGMEFDYYTDGVALGFAQSSDICAILGNLLDNALEGGARSTDKTIQVDVYENERQEVVIAVANSCDQPPVVKDQELLSTKQDDKPHGFGLKSVRRAAQRYDGELATAYDEAERTFRATVLLRPQGRSAVPEQSTQSMEVDGS